MLRRSFLARVGCLAAGLISPIRWPTGPDRVVSNLGFSGHVQGDGHLWTITIRGDDGFLWTIKDYPLSRSRMHELVSLAGRSLPLCRLRDLLGRAG